MSWLFASIIFWSVFWTVFYLVARQLDTNDYSHKPSNIPEEGDHIYVRQEAYNRYEEQSYG